ncbi:mediator of DNA damage checkpoint protein 1 isoform X3 [Polyergus mexicanus]|uniref:mediator of DNA damage checkpoint protein 1 isoform X3 n=1 Tax=Polyergus mexicanus TaxID=615972 RepID=UPI0038B5EDEF
MPANKSNLSTPRKEKPGNGLIAATAAATSKKKKRPACIKNKKHCKQYLQLHSEYRSTYTWHEYTGPHQEHAVVRRAPQPPLSTMQPSAKLQSAKSTEDENNEGPTLEPPLPRRKKCPELAYKTHEFITAADGGGIDAIDSNVVADKIANLSSIERKQEEERTNNRILPRIEKYKEVTSALPPSQLSKAISRISTEYRLQFAWPKKPQLINGETQAPVVAAGFSAASTGHYPPRKSLSMGALKQGITTTGPAPVHKKRPGDFGHKRDGIQASELEPLVGSETDAIDGMVPEGDEREEDMTDLKITFRKKKLNKNIRVSEAPGKSQVKPFPMAEVIELRRLADEYKHRDWGCDWDLTAEDEASLWKQVSNNHTLNALSLARSVTKEEKEKENRKVAPIVSMIATKPPAGRPSSEQDRPIHGLLQDDTKADNDRAIARARKDFLIRHHLDRTTGVGDGALLPSPTREKLEPVIPRRRDDMKEHRDEIQPRTKSSPKNSPRTGRSQSLGPTVTDRRSPKRQPIRAPSVTKDAKEKEKEMKDKEQREKSSEPERRPRPTAAGPGHRVRWSIRELATPISSVTGLLTPPIPPLPPPPPGPGPALLHRTPFQAAHRKSFLATTALPHRPLHHAKPTTTITTNTTTTTVTNANSTSASIAPVKRSPVKHSVHTTVHHPPTSGAAAAAARPERGVKDLSQRCRDANDEVQAKLARGHPAAAAAAAGNDPSSKSSLDTRSASNQAATAVVQAMTAEPQINGDVTGGDSSVASTPPSQKHAAVPMSVMQASQWLDDEPVVKSPPEPTRVKSPEQMIMRSPEPVNWTVPLDTGKTFTVTQNVREEPLTRPHSETKTWAPSSVPSAPQSAPPELAAQHKSQHSGYKSPESESVSLGSFSGINGHKDLDSERDSPLPTNVEDNTSTKTEKIIGIVEETKERQSPEPSVKSVAGTNLRYLEDPTSEMEKKKDSSPPTTITTTLATTSSSMSPATQQSYRILEAESSPQDTGGSGGTTSTGSSTIGGYHVLEAPAIVPDSTQRSAASDVLEKARNRFDKFWGKGGNNGTEN